ncbi:PLD nuclease N-terminal domain-containing protein [candidate division KSB1 bacterium]
MAFLKIGGLWGLLTLIAVVWVIIDILPRKRRFLNKVFWIAIAVLFGILGALAYYIFGRR